MARMTFEQSEKESSRSNDSEWFYLKNDGDVARVQFMLNGVDDIPIYSVHKVKVNGKDRYVDCLRTSHTDPVDVCPFCKAKLESKITRYIFMFDVEEQKVKLWERGKQFVSKLQGLMNRYSPLSDHVFEIERHGVAGDKETKYELYPMDGIESFDLSEMEIPNLEGTLILQKSAEEMQEYLTKGVFPEKQDTAQNLQQVTRRAPEATSSPTASRATRRTPASSNASVNSSDEVF